MQYLSPDKDKQRYLRESPKDLPPDHQWRNFHFQAKKTPAGNIEAPVVTVINKRPQMGEYEIGLPVNT